MDDNSGSDDEFSDATDHTMAPIKLECQVPDCTGGTGGARWSCEEEPTVAVALLNSHGYTHQTAPTAATTSSSRKPRPQPLNPPKLEAGLILNVVLVSSRGSARVGRGVNIAIIVSNVNKER